MAKPTTELAKRCKPPPYTHWDQRGEKPVLLSDLNLIDSDRKCKRLSFQTDDPEIAKRYMRLLVPSLVAQGRLSADSGAAKVYHPKGSERSRLKKFDTEVHRLKALSQAKYGSEAPAKAKRWRLPVGIIHCLAGRKPALSAGTYATRRLHARRRGRVTLMGDTWEHRAQGGKYFGWNGNVLAARLQIGGRHWQWTLKGIDEEKAEALMGPVRVARERLQRAAAEELKCELGTDAAAAAAEERAGARTQLASAIITAGGPKKLVEFVLKGPQEEVATDIPQRLVLPRAVRRAMKLAALAPAIGQDPSMPNLTAKSVQDERCRLKPAPRFMQWYRGPRGKFMLQCAVYLSDGSRLSSGLKTDDTEVVGPQRMRLLLSHAIAERQLPLGVKHPAWGLYGGPIPQSTKRLLMRLTGLPWAEYEPHRKEPATSLGYHATTIDWLTKHDKARAETPAAVKSRRARLRKDGHRFPKRDSWHFGPLGSMLAIHPDGPIYAQLTIAGSTFRWRLKARDREEAAAIMESVRSARAQMRKAAEEWGDCELGTPASVTTEARVVTTCGLFATALSAVGAPDEYIRLAMRPPTEVGTSSLLPVAASRRAMKQVDEKKCVDELTKLIKANARMTIPEVIRWAKQNFGVPRRRAVEVKNCCLDQARKQAKNFEWPPRGRPSR